MYSSINSTDIAVYKQTSFIIDKYRECLRTWQLAQDVLADAGLVCNKPAMLRDML
jgi:hypothetical protein